MCTCNLQRRACGTENIIRKRCMCIPTYLHTYIPYLVNTPTNRCFVGGTDCQERWQGPPTPRPHDTEKNRCVRYARRYVAVCSTAGRACIATRLPGWQPAGESRRAYMCGAAHAHTCATAPPRWPRCQQQPACSAAVAPCPRHRVSAPPRCGHQEASAQACKRKAVSAPERYRCRIPAIASHIVVL